MSQSLRAFRPINKDEQSPVRKEFKVSTKWQKEDPDHYARNFTDSPEIYSSNKKVRYIYRPDDTNKSEIKLQQK
jgi:hypothetical protein